MKLNNILLHLSLIEGVGPAAVKRIMQSFSDAEIQDNIYHLRISDFMHHCNLSENIAQRLSKGLSQDYLLQEELNLLEKYAINLVTIKDDTYPSLLSAIHVPPVVLYYRGQLSNFGIKSLAVVGSRQATLYGANVLEKIIPDLVKNNIAIISGGARGIDSIAHKQAIASGGKTVAILGSGLINPYPSSNRKLFESIVEHQGAVVSPFSLRTIALPGNFPARNRIIAGMSHGCLVVQAAQKSGALITARYAVEQGREVFAVPGPIDSALSQGCHALIQDGAALITNAQDITQQFSLPFIATWDMCSSLSEQEENVLSICSNPQSLDDLSRLTCLSSEDLYGILFDMQIKGLLEQDFMGLWKQC